MTETMFFIIAWAAVAGVTGYRLRSSGLSGTNFQLATFTLLLTITIGVSWGIRAAIP